tara:strand:+ start:1067 stop:2083 length:1017 start_codon:yes stop_codon:yes gene_type:complete
MAVIKTGFQFARWGSLSTIRWFRPRVAAELERLRGVETLVVVEFSQLAPYAMAARGLTWHLDMHNVESELLGNYARSVRGPRRVVAQWERWRVLLLERRSVRAARSVSVVSPIDMSWVRRQGAGADRCVLLAPNGVDEAAFSVPPGSRGLAVVFVGHLGWAPNVDAADWLTTSVWPIVRESAPEARLFLVGRYPHRRVFELENEESGVTVIPNPDDVWPYIQSSRVATAPLLAAGGTRLKILEALALGTPVVATSLGALGLEALEGRDLAICDSPNEFAEAVCLRLREEPSMDRCRSTVANYSWPVVLTPMVEQIVRLADVEDTDGGDPKWSERSARS